MKPVTLEEVMTAQKNNLIAKESAINKCVDKAIKKVNKRLLTSLYFPVEVNIKIPVKLWCVIDKIGNHLEKIFKESGFKANFDECHGYSYTTFYLRIRKP